ncbi:hypothetical protein A9Q81_00960 [Gammaproteobacteria bacterium 42_54_T18]|nr:hypothetical protein A9Q81_00960 [Gammaproteobacteria bacterium 42_54_T18]
MILTPIGAQASPFIDEVIATSQSTPINNYSRQQSLSSEVRHNVYIWQGFEHEWQRFVALRNAGRVPHRISKLHNYIQQPEDSSSHASFHFAQGTGVDGNYMNPKGNYSTIESESINSLSGNVLLQWTDEITDSSTPVANNKIHDIISIPLDVIHTPSSHTDFNIDTDVNNNALTVILQGIQLDLSCNNDLQPESNPCNSNGMWPYIFNIAIDQCEATETHYNCDLNVDIYRAWTPNKGGFQLPPLFEEIKPLNHRLDYTLRVHFSAISAPPTTFSPQTNDDIFTSKDIHQRRNQNTTLETYSPQVNLTQSTHAIRSFGFALSNPELLEQHWQVLGSDTSQQGRYIGKLSNLISSHKQFNQNSQATISQSLWAPITVVNATSHTSIGTRSLFFADNVFISETQTAKGKLCINSTEQAPAFSRWSMCNYKGWLARIIYGGKQQLSHAVTLPLQHQY